MYPRNRYNYRAIATNNKCSSWKRARYLQNCSCKTKLTLTHINTDKSASSFASLPAGARYILIFFTPSPIPHHTSNINGAEGAAIACAARYLPSELISERSRNELSSWTCYFYVQPSESTRVLIAKSTR